MTSSRRQSQRAKGDAFEQFLESEGLGRVVSGSGSTAESKGDNVGKYTLVQAKCTEKKSYTIHFDDLVKAEAEAMNRGKIPLFTIGFYSEHEVASAWVMVPLWALRQR